MNGFILVLPVIIIRYGILPLYSRDGAKRAAFFPPTRGNEKIAFWVYQITTLAMMLFLLFLQVEWASTNHFIGLGIYMIGMLLYLISIIQFAKPNKTGLNINGLYKRSRNPMYVGFFLYFLGCSLLTGSWILFVILIIFQMSVHYLILSEERWCIKEFGVAYVSYMKKVRRYI